MLKPLLLAAAFASAALTFSATTDQAHAGAPLAKTGNPGYYRMMLGDFEITALSDGTVPLPVEKLLTGTTPAKVEAALAKVFLKTPVETSVNCFLVNTGTKLVLIDAGAGGLFGPTLGKLIASLNAAGYKPEQIDEIYITHLHPDHVGNLSANGKIAFPNAIVRAGKGDIDQFLSKDNAEKAPKEMKDFYAGAQASMNPYAAAGKLKPIEADGELVPGIKAVAANGHTPGHTFYQIESKGQKLVVWGDLIHVAAVQFAEPAVTIQFDSDAKKAAAERKKAFADAAKQGYFVAIAHISFPGIGQLRSDGAGYRWLPVNYSPAK